jgi:hypothetical protein
MGRVDMNLVSEEGFNINIYMGIQEAHAIQFQSKLTCCAQVTGLKQSC